MGKVHPEFYNTWYVDYTPGLGHGTAAVKLVIGVGFGLAYLPVSLFNERMGDDVGETSAYMICRSLGSLVFTPLALFKWDQKH